MKNIIIYSLCFALVTLNSTLSWAKHPQPITIHPNIETTVYSYKKTKHFVAVEIGFTNPTNHYIRFTPTEIYLNDKHKYSVSLMPFEDLQHIEQRSTNISALPYILGAVLGIASIATSGSNRDVARALGIAALGVGGAFIISSILASKAKNNQLIAFQNNSLRTTKRIPPGKTIGGFLYFPRVKKPTSITIVSRSKSGTYEKHNISLKKTSSPRKKRFKNKYR